MSTDDSTDKSEGIKRKLANLRPPWKKGESGNPKGVPKLTDIEKAAREASRLEVAETFQWLKNATDYQLREIVKDQDESQVAKWMASSILFGRKKGDLSELHRMYDRLLGRSRQDISASLSFPSARERAETVAKLLMRIDNDPDTKPSDDTGS